MKVHLTQLQRAFAALLIAGMAALAVLSIYLAHDRQEPLFLFVCALCGGMTLFGSVWLRNTR